MSARILLLEDDEIIAAGLVYTLQENGYTVQHCSTVSQAVDVIALPGVFDLAILDMQLPDGTGFDVKDKLGDTPVIFLTVVDDEGNIVRAFDNGAQDYITKPFRLYEFLARVRRVLGGTALPQTKLGDVTIDTQGGNVYVGNKLVELTALEYRLLLIFAKHRGQVLSRGQILDMLWEGPGHFVEDNTLTVYVKRLREKLGETIGIQTIRGRGYRVD